MADERELTVKQQIQRDINKSLKSESEITSNYAKLLNEQLNTQKEITKQVKDRVKVLQGLKKADDKSSDIHDRINKLQKEASKTAEKLSKSRRADGKFAKGYNQLIEKGLKNDKGAQFAKLKQLKLQRLSNLAQSTANTLSGGMLDKVKGISKFVGKVGPGFAVATVASLGLVAAAGLLVKALKFASDITDALGQQFGVVGAQSGEFKDNMMDASVEVISLGKGTQDVVTLVDTLSKDFGISLNTAAELSNQILDTAVALGISNEQSAKLFGTLMTIGDLTADQAENLAESTYQLARQNNVNPSAVMQDIADNSQLIAKFGAENAESLAKAAVQARQLGLNLSTVEQISDSLLSFQSSLNAEIEASIMVGKQLNFQKARELAITGDMSGMMDEVISQLGDESDLILDNVLARKSLAASVGIEVEQMDKLLKAQDKSIVQQKAFSDLAGEDAISSLTSITNKIKEIGATILIKLGTPLENLLKNFEKRFFTDANIAKVEKFITGFLDTMISVGKAVANIVSMFAGVADFLDFSLMGVIKKVINLNPIGLLTSFFTGKSLSSMIGVNDFRSGGGSHLILTPTGRMLQTNPRDTIMGSTKVNDFVSGPAGSNPIGTDTKKLEEKIDELISITRGLPDRNAQALGVK